MRHLRRNETLAIAWLVAVAGTAWGGDPNPPPGPVGPTMKTLTELDPRIIVNNLPGDADSMHRITAPGRYVFLLTVFVSAGKSGIEVDIPPGTAGEVSIDMNGCSIQGEPGSQDGVRYRNNENCVWVVTCPDGRISGMGGDGIHIEGGAEAILRGVSVTNCGGDGIEMRGLKRGLAVDMERRSGGFLVAQNGGNGVAAADCADVFIQRLHTNNNGLHGVLVENAIRVQARDAYGNNNLGDGFRFVNVTAQAQAAAERADVGAIRASGNGGNGVHIENFPDMSVADVEVRRSLGHGVVCIPGHNPLNRPAYMNFTACLSSDNGLDGMRLIFSEQIRFSASMGASRCLGNGGSGLHVEWAAGGSAGGGGGGGGGAIRLTDSIFDGNIGDGVRLNRDRSKSIDMRAEDCSMSRNGGDGLKSYFETGDVPTEEQFHTLIDSRAIGNGGTGLHFETTHLCVRDCEASSNSVDGLKFQTTSPGHKSVGEITLRAMNNGGNGMLFEGPLDVSVEGSKAGGNGFVGAVVPGAGILSSAVSSIRVVNTECSNNASHGIAIADLNRDGILDFVTCTGNGGSGVATSTLSGLPCGSLSLRRCIAQQNIGHGLDLQCSSGGDVRECIFRGNGGLGASASGVGHVFVWNTMADNAGGPFVVPVPGNSVGPALEEVFMPTDEKPHSNYVR